MTPACALIGASFTGCDKWATVALVQYTTFLFKHLRINCNLFLIIKITVATGFNGAIYSGFIVITLKINYFSSP